VHAGRLDIARALTGNRVDLASATREQSLANPEPIIRSGTPSHGRAAGRVDDQIGGYVRASTMDCSPADSSVHKSQLRARECVRSRVLPNSLLPEGAPPWTSSCADHWLSHQMTGPGARLGVSAVITTDHARRSQPRDKLTIAEV
jgi:hypothetical protein